MSLLQSAGRLAGAFLLVLQLAACSYTLQSTRLQTSAPANLPPSRELASTPFFPQQRYQCGPAALATVLAGRGVSVQPAQLVGKVYLPARQGSVPLEMEVAARGYGMLVYPLAADMEVLLSEVAAGHPVLVLQNLGFSWWPRWHYAVVVGYDLAEATVLLRSGTTRRYRVAMGLFETTWRRADYWARVILPPGRFPATAEPLPYARAALALEQSGQQQAALTAYRAATGRWPESVVNWLARGNLAYGLGEDREAEASFRGGLEVAPEHADLWNNLGYALARQGCHRQALQAVQCAIALQPDTPAYHDSLRELEVQTSATALCDAVVCPLAAD
jgi:hypothetical protein